MLGTASELGQQLLPLWQVSQITLLRHLGDGLRTATSDILGFPCAS